MLATVGATVDNPVIHLCAFIAFFPASGAYPYQKDLAKVDFNLLDTGHFALEELGDVIAAHIQRFATTL